MKADQYGLSTRDHDTIINVFKRYPEVFTVYIFGSRAKGEHKDGSDVDLAIMNKGVSDLSVARMKEEFSESSLPYRVDLVDFTKIDHQDLIDHINRVGALFYTQHSL